MFDMEDLLAPMGDDLLLMAHAHVACTLMFVYLSLLQAGGDHNA
jgi:hypothetical protein